MATLDGLRPIILRVKRKVIGARTKATNPVGRYLAVAAFGTLGVVGVAALAGWPPPLALAVKPLLLVCAVLSVAYTLFALRLGSIGMVSQTGRIYRYSRRGEPILFYLLVLLYLALSIPTALYVGWQMIGA